MVTSNGQPLPSVQLTARQKTCQSITSQTDSSGAFNLSLPTSIDFSPTPVSLQFSKPGFLPLTITQQTGGIPLRQREKRMEVEMVPVDSAPGGVKITLLNALRNRVVTNATVEVRTGINNFTGPVEFSAPVKEDRTAYFQSVLAGAYSVRGVAEGFSGGEGEVVVGGGKTTTKTMLLSPMDLVEGQVRVTLTWTMETMDLDLRVKFAVNKNVSCDVGYNNRLCAGTKLVAESTTGLGGETVTMVEVGPFQYLFYVQNSDKLKTFQQSSSPEVSIYTSALAAPLLRLKLPKQTSPSSYWSVFCLSGLEGVATLSPLQTTSESEPSYDVCKEAFGERMEVELTEGGKKVERKSTEVELPKAFKHWKGSN